MLKIQVFIVIITLLLIPVSVFAEFEIKEDIDKFEGTSKVYMSDTKNIAGFFDKYKLEIVGFQMKNKEGETDYYLEAQFKTLYKKVKLNIQEGVSLLLLIDDNLVELTTVSTPISEIRHSTSAEIAGWFAGEKTSKEIYGEGEFLFECAQYSVTPSLFWQLANAKTVEVRVKGEEKNVDHKFSDKLIEQYKKFCEYLGITADSIVVK